MTLKLAHKIATDLRSRQNRGLYTDIAKAAMILDVRVKLLDALVECLELRCVIDDKEIARLKGTMNTFTGMGE